ncbi:MULTISPECIES: ParA family protein [Halobacterium]|uniref:ParA domain protein n=4 Tax=Halobacterium salinarum TaxID=2242 RepID=Q9HHU2_HALSA|nr:MULTISPECIES: ParA family protein [Halobacterium]AAG20884.1 Vng6225c [Halobacterium salinarum NRC-1]MBB6090607.1 cellulose biosynthesis protein BcsQ [Halobacterium salinarum]MCF2164914.1 ParA family protein [Halobacterium salinarum]MCF2168992.1 ParA family protein [Halobacterium salinarum]MCF2207592.1 ParA family protein [Halobacterium salinarum]
MITAVVYAESGGTFKTTMTANLAVALSRMDLDVLVLDLDPQTGNLTSLFDVGEDRSDPNADNLVKHILEMPDGDFASLIETSPEGVDIVPSHDMLSDFTSNLEQKITYETGVKDVSREEYPRYELLYRLLWEREQVNEQYDVVLIDPNARAEDLLYNAMYALRTLVAPVKPAGKGSLSLDGLEEMVGNMETELDIGVGLSCVVPCGVGQTNAHKQYRDRFETTDAFATPVSIGSRESLMDAMWEAHGSAFKVIEERWKTYEGDDGMVSERGKRRVPDRELETLETIWRLAGFIATDTFDATVPEELVLDIVDDGTETLQMAGNGHPEVAD